MVKGLYVVRMGQSNVALVDTFKLDAFTVEELPLVVVVDPPPPLFVKLLVTHAVVATAVEFSVEDRF
jgi:hypothetical protein